MGAGDLRALQAAEAGAEPAGQEGPGAAQQVAVRGGLHGGQLGCSLQVRRRRRRIHTGGDSHPHIGVRCCLCPRAGRGEPLQAPPLRAALLLGRAERLVGRIVPCLRLLRGVSAEELARLPVLLVLVSGVAEVLLLKGVAMIVGVVVVSQGVAAAELGWAAELLLLELFPLLAQLRSRRWRLLLV